MKQWLSLSNWSWFMFDKKSYILEAKFTTIQQFIPFGRLLQNNSVQPGLLPFILQPSYQCFSFWEKRKTVETNQFSTNKMICKADHQYLNIFITRTLYKLFSFLFFGKWLISIAIVTNTQKQKSDWIITLSRFIQFSTIWTKDQIFCIPDSI